MLTIKLFSFVCLILLSCFLNAKSLKLGVGQDIPPYVLRESNSGIELDIAREALLVKGHKITLEYLPFGRVMLALENGDVDAALTVNEDSGIAGIHYSNTHITYQNVAIGLNQQKLQVANIASLNKYSVLAFQFASRYLGNEFKLMASHNPDYSEKGQQNIQVSMLYLKRVQIVVLDLNIFKYYKKLESRVDTGATIDVFEIFPPTPYKVGFRNVDLKKDFNLGLSKLKKSGRYDEIIKKYTD